MEKKREKEDFEKRFDGESISFPRSHFLVDHAAMADAPFGGIKYKPIRNGFMWKGSTTWKDPHHVPGITEDLSFDLNRSYSKRILSEEEFPLLPLRSSTPIQSPMQRGEEKKKGEEGEKKKKAICLLSTTLPIHGQGRKDKEDEELALLKEGVQEVKKGFRKILKCAKKSHADLFYG
ncbi:MAG: hypothetical protein AAFR83_23265 [Cyanobacteria bacterium J06629_18]